MNSKRSGTLPAARRALKRLTACCTFAFFAASAGTALAGAGMLGPGDEQLASGEYYDRVLFEGNAGDQITIGLTSTDFNPYVMVLDAGNNALAFQDDAPGAGQNVSLGFTLPASGQYTLLVTSSLPGETGRYALTLAAPGQQTAAAPAAQQAVTGQPGPNSVTGQPGPNSVTGVVLDTNGQPVAGARVRVVPELTTGGAEVHTDANGRFLVQDLPAVPYRVRAWLLRDYRGDQVCLRLGMDSAADYDTFSATAGAVRNFRWQLTGDITGQDMRQATFGGTLDVRNTWLFEGRGATIEFSFTPSGPLIDGSTGTAFTRTLDPDRDAYVYDIPIGPYRLEATLVGSDGSRQALPLSENDWGSEQLPVFSLDWESAGDCDLHNGWQWTSVYVWEP